MSKSISVRSRAYGHVVAIAGAVVAGVTSSNANAEFLTYTFAAPLTAVGFGGPPSEPPFPPRVPEGLPPELTSIDQLLTSNISGYVTIDNAAIDRNPASHLGSYGGPAIVPLFYMTLNGHTFSYDYRALQPSTYASLTVNNLDTPPQFGLPANGIYIQSGAGTGFFDNAPASNYSVQMDLGLSIFDDLSIIDSDAMPMDLSVFDRPWMLQLLILDRTSGLNISYHSLVDLNRYVEQVPTPATFALFALGLVGIPLARRRRGQSLTGPGSPRL